MFMETANVFEQREKLKDLEAILVKKYEIELKIEDAPNSLNHLYELLVNRKGDYINTNTAYEAAKTKISQLKVDLEEAVADRERGEQGMDSITTHREYEALDKEIKDASEKESQLRKELQTEERHFESLSAELISMEQKLEVAQKDLDETKNAWASNVAIYQAELEELNARKDEIVTGLDPEMIFKFERIVRKQKSGTAKVKGNVCDGCHMILPAQFANEVRRDEEFIFCPYCSRILFYEELEEGEAAFSLEDAGSLVDYDYDDYDEDMDDDEDQDEVRELGEED